MEIWENFKQTKMPDAIVIDKKVYELFCELFQGYPIDRILIIDNPEEKKSILGMQDIINFFLSLNLAKNELVYGIGGGALLDLVGFCSAIYKRGIRNYFFPTTLLAMVDASVGGKNGINYLGIKNLLGTIKEAEKTIFYFPFLNTLDEIQIKSGLAEALKMGLILDAELFELLNLQTIDHDLILRSARLKQSITKEDLFDSKNRHILNFGHTFGHALESAHKFSIPHGYAVAYGMIVEAKVSSERGILNEKEFLKIKNKILSIYGPLDMICFDQIRPFMVLDKKNEGSLRAHILKTIGQSPELLKVSHLEFERAYQSLWT